MDADSFLLSPGSKDLTLSIPAVSKFFMNFNALSDIPFTTPLVLLAALEIDSVIGVILFIALLLISPIF